MAQRNIVVTVVLLLLLMVSVGTVTLWAVWTPPKKTNPLDQARLELLSDVDTIRIAQLSLHDFEEAYVPCGSADEARAAVKGGDIAWKGGDCWTKLGFNPLGTPRGAWWVDVNEDGFEVHGLADLDADGTPIEIVATKDQTARAVTPAGVY